MNNNKIHERYQRQIILKEFGDAAQEKLLQSKVLMVGAGGLGCPVLQYLTAAGIGTIGIIDDDVVSLNNLHRQVLYNVDDIGLSKAEVAAMKLLRLNNDINIISYNLRLTNTNALSILNSYDIIIDGTDNFSSRYLINDACVLLNKPTVYGAISKFEGQLAVFNVRNTNEKSAINYRNLFPTPPKDDEVFNCAEAGVIGVLPGIIGTMMANETIKLITGIGKLLNNKLVTYNTLNNSLYEFNLSPNVEAQQLIPKDEAAFLKMDYEWLCSSQTNNAFEIDVDLFDTLIKDVNTLIIDVRNKYEHPVLSEFNHIQIPLNDLPKQQLLLNRNNIVLLCQSGKRSLQAAKMLNEMFTDKKIYSLKGGIIEWKKKHALNKSGDIQ